MSTNSETGHPVNANNFIGKVNRVKQEGESYKPSNAEILITALEPICALITTAMKTVSETKAALVNATAKRKIAYVQMDAYATNAVDMLKSSGATREEEDHASSLLAKYKGERIGDVPNEEEIKAKAVAEGKEAVIPKTISVSQQGFINKLSKFTDIVVYLKTVTAYKPNEEELKTETLELFIEQVGKLNEAKDNASKAYTDALVERNKLMYAEPSGAYFLSKKIMKYVSSTKGKKSQLYKDLQKLPVKRF